MDGVSKLKLVKKWRNCKAGGETRDKREERREKKARKFLGIIQDGYLASRAI